MDWIDVTLVVEMSIWYKLVDVSVYADVHVEVEVDVDVNVYSDVNVIFDVDIDVEVVWPKPPNDLCAFGNAGKTQ